MFKLLELYWRTQISVELLPKPFVFDGLSKRVLIRCGICISGIIQRKIVISIISLVNNDF